MREGATVAIGDINIDAAEKTAREIGPKAYAVKLDVHRPGLHRRSGEGGGGKRPAGSDILIHNAALFDAAPIVEISRASYDKLFSVNVAGTLFTLQAAARSMIARGKGGKIINMASQAGRRGEALVAVYCATKAAVDFADPVGRARPHQAPHQRQRDRAGRGRRRALGRRRRAVREVREA